MTGLGLMALAMAGVFSGFLVEAAVPGLPRPLAFAAVLAAPAVWFLGSSVRTGATTPGWRRRGEAIERAGALVGVAIFAGVLALAQDVTLNHGEGFARGMAAGGLALSGLLAAASTLRERLFGTSLEHEGRVVASEYRRGVEVRVGWDLVHGVALGEFAQHMALFVLADVEPAIRAARPAQSARWIEKRLKEARQWRGLAGADVVVMAMQADQPLGEMKERIGRGIGALALGG